MSGGEGWRGRSTKFFHLSVNDSAIDRAKVLIMEIHSDSLVLGILFSCSLPLLLLTLFVAAVLSTRSKLKAAAQMKKDLQDGVYDLYFSNPKTSTAYCQIIEYSPPDPTPVRSCAWRE